MAVNQPPEPEQIGWRDAFWRLCALAFVRFRLGIDPPRFPGQQEISAHSQD